jgi:hypothetical protein
MLIFRKKVSYFLLTFFISLLLNSREGKSQYYLIGTDPSSVGWRQIKTPNFKVIYPRILESQGQYIANGLEYNYHPGSRSLFDHTSRTPVIIHNQTTVPSSVTYLAPGRMEFFTTSPQDIFPQDWTDQLIIHEFRHAVQYSAINVGFTKGLSCVVGEQGPFFGIIALFLPMWFIEGDATVAETALHYTGRGRTPSFEARLRAQLVEKGIYSYEKANYGSYIHFVPGKYELGYQLVGRTRVNYGTSVWSKVLNNVGRRPYTVVPFSSGIKKQTGLNKYRLYDTLTKQMQRTWRAEDKVIQENKYQILTNTPEKFYTSYNLPAIFRDSMIISVKSTQDDLTKIVLLNNEGKVRDLCNVGVNYYSESLTASDSVIYWSELVNDPRWLLRDYRVIRSYNFNTGKTTQLTRLTRYYAPSVTRDGRYLAAVEVTPENKYFLVILNSNDGSLIRKINTPDNLLFIHPRWSDDGKSVVSVVFGKEGNNLAITDPASGKTEILLPFSFMEMKRPSFYRNYILFTASYNGKDNIYAFNRNTKDVFMVTSARFGASDAFVSNDLSSMIYSNYTADGYKIVKQKLDTAMWNKISVPVKSAFPLAEALTLQENFIYNPDSVPKNKYDSKRYSKALNLFNFHSWVPVGINMQNFTYNGFPDITLTGFPGVTLLSQNLLGTTVTSLGYIYNRNEKTSKYSLSITNESLYPVISLGIDYGGRKGMGIFPVADSIAGKWKEFNLSAGLKLPFSWTHNCWTRSFQPAIGMNYKYLDPNKNNPIEFDPFQITVVNYSLVASNILKTSQRDLLPRWSQKLELNFNNTPFNINDNSFFAAQLTMDLPGFGKHHGLHLYGAYQKKTETNYSFSDVIFFPKGYTSIFENEIYSFSAMYSMPLFYPEWEIKNLMYFKRFKTAFFYDYAKNTNPLFPRSFSSIGLDLTSDFSLFNLIAPLDFGLRLIYIPETGGMKIEPLISLNFAAMY